MGFGFSASSCGDDYLPANAMARGPTIFVLVAMLFGTKKRLSMLKRVHTEFMIVEGSCGWESQVTPPLYESVIARDLYFACVPHSAHTV